MVLLAALGDPRDDAVVLDVVGVVGLDVGGQPVQCPLKRVLAARVHHARLPRSKLANGIQHALSVSRRPYVLRRIIRHPRDEGDLAPLALASSLILNIKHRVPSSDALNTRLVLALGIEQLLAEFAVVGVGGGLLDDDLLPVVADLVDDPLDVLAEL